MTAAYKIGRDAPWDPDEEITVQRRVHVPASAPIDPSTRRTTQITKVDARLLAIARGERDPDEVDPFGGLIPIYDNDDEPVEDVDDDWLTFDLAPELDLEPESEVEGGPASTDVLFARVKPRVRLPAAELAVLPVGDRTALFLSRIDGKRTVQELVDPGGFDELETLEIMHELLRMGVIDLL